VMLGWSQIVTVRSSWASPCRFGLRIPLSASQWQRASEPTRRIPRFPRSNGEYWCMHVEATP
jgi:hypothetical protein